MPEFKSKKDQAYEDWQTKGRCEIEIKVNGEILEWFSRDLQLTFGDGDGLEKIRIKACYGNKRAVEVVILVEWSRSSSKTKNS